MAKMRVQGSRVIISGHETTKEECNAVTLMCDEMAKSKDFRLVEYRPGYAEFEAVGQAEDLKFALEPSSITMNFDSGITSVEMSGDAELTWTQSGTNLSFNGTGLGSYTFTVICADGKVLDSVDLSSLYNYTNYTRDSENVFSLTGNTTPSGEITLTSKASPSVPTPDWANCFVKTASGNKAVEKVWIKQNGQLVTVWDGG